jgi:tetratricopeptide (TPR) repeat protein
MGRGSGQSRKPVAPVPGQKAPVAAQKPAAPSAEPDYSKEAFIHEDVSMKVAFQNDGTSTRESYERIRILSDAGVQHYSLVTFPYESATQTVEIDYVRVRKPDGTVVVTPPDGVQDMPADITRQAPFYSDLHEKQVAVKGLGVGDVLEASAHWQTTKPLAPGQFWLSFNFERDSIVLHEELQVGVPSGRAIKYDSPGYAPTVATQGSRELLTWTFSQLHSQSADQQKKQEEGQTYETAIGQLPPPDIQISSFQTWEEVGAWYQGLQRDPVIPDAAIRAEAVQLTKGAADDDAKLRAIYDYVSSQSRYIGVAFGITRYQPHSASETLANQYGDCKDKHTLLASLLDAVGIKAYPVLINTTHKLDPAVPSPGQFDHVITAVPRDNGFTWLDTTTEIAPFGYLLGMLRGKSALLIPDAAPATLVVTPAAPPMPSLQTFQIDATLNDNSTLQGKVQRSFGGNDSALALRAAFRSISMMHWTELVQRLSYAASFSGDVSDVTVSPPEKTDQPLTISYTYTRKDFPQWSDHRMAVALPPVLTPPPDEKPSHPILLGEPGEERYESRIVFPSGYTPELPTDVNLDQPFAAYHAAYSIKNGALQVDRTFLIKMRSVPLEDFDAYKKFSKAVQDDFQLYVSFMQTHVTPALYQSAIWALPYSANADAARAYDEARDDYNKNDSGAEISALKRAVEIDPKFTRAWLWMSEIYLFQRNRDEALSALRSAVANDPKQPLAYKGLGFALMSEQNFNDAAAVWKQLMQVAPNDPDGPTYLGATLSVAKHYAEAAAAFESAAKLDSKSAPLYTQLGSAYLLAGDEPKALAAYQTALSLDSSAVSLNDIGYALADADKQLPLALQYIQKAVQHEEEASAKVKLSDLKKEDLYHATSLSAFWDSLGWVYFRMGNLAEAENYLDSAWALSQATDMGDHLAQVYEKENKKRQAIHTFELALSTTHNPELTKAMWDRLADLGVSPDGDMPRSDPGAELSHARTFVVKGPNVRAGSAEFFLLFAPGSKPPDVRFISGSDELKDAGKFLSAVKFNVLFPDNGPELLLRRGILSCDPLTKCLFVLYPLQSVRSVN